MAEIDELFATFLPLLIPLVIALAGGTSVGLYAVFKSRLASVSAFISALNKAFEDDSLSPAEIKNLGDLFLKIIQQNPTAAKALLNNSKE